MAPERMFSYRASVHRPAAPETFPPPLSGELVHVRIAARDADRAAAFYAALFGWEIGAASPSGTTFRMPGGVEGAFWPNTEPCAAGPELYVRVQALEAVLARAVRLGGARVARPAPWPAGGRVAVLLDTEGNRIGLWECGLCEPEVEKCAESPVGCIRCPDSERPP